MCLQIVCGGEAPWDRSIHSAAQPHGATVVLRVGGFFGEKSLVMDTMQAPATLLAGRDGVTLSMISGSEFKELMTESCEQCINEVRAQPARPILQSVAWMHTMHNNACVNHQAMSCHHRAAATDIAHAGCDAYVQAKDLQLLQEDLQASLSGIEQPMAPASLATLEPLGTLWVQGPQQLHVAELDSTSGHLALIRAFSVQDTERAGCSHVLLRQRALSRALGPRPGVPSTSAVLKTGHVVAEVLHGPTQALCALDDVLAAGPVDVDAARFIVASVVVRLVPLSTCTSAAVQRAARPHRASMVPSARPPASG